MKRYIVAFAAISAITGLTACGSTAVTVSTNPQVRAQEAKAQKIIQGCVAKSNFITHSGRQKFIACIAPPGEKATIEKCVQAKVASDGVLTKHERQKLESDIAGCIVR